MGADYRPDRYVDNLPRKKSTRPLLWASLVVLVALVAAGGWYFFMKDSPPTINNPAGNINSSSPGPTWESLEEAEQMAFDRLHSPCLSVGPDTKFKTDLPGRAAVAKRAVEALSTEWEFFEICRDSLNNSLFHILAFRYPSKGSASQGLISNMKTFFPRESSRYLSDELTEYALYEYASHLTVINQGKRSIRIEPNQPYLVNQWAWGSALAGCILQPGDYSRTGKIAIGCGGGDNGCFVSEFARFGIVSHTVDRDGVCSGNCDLPETEPATIQCS